MAGRAGWIEALVSENEFLMAEGLGCGLSAVCHLVDEAVDFLSDAIEV